MFRCLFAVLTVAVIGLDIARADVFNMPSGETSLQTVSVGDVNNPANTTGFGSGSVGYLYEIGKFEITNAQYAQFLNSQLPGILDAETGVVLPHDTYGLFNTNMDSQLCGGITYTPGAATGSKFAAKPGLENHPVNYVCWFDAIRFVNWLQNGQIPGATESGAYTILDGGQNSGTVTIPDERTRAGWTTSHFLLPTLNEWYKAAYYQPADKGGSADGYWLYPTRSDIAPINTDLAIDPGNHGNFYDDYGTGTGSYSVGYPLYTTNVGEFYNSASHYGTYDQAGNVLEWIQDDLLGDGSSHGMLGGCYANGPDTFSSRPQGSAYSAYEDTGTGFRISVVGEIVPEPSSVSLLLMGVASLAILIRRRGDQNGNVAAQKRSELFTSKNGSVSFCN